jgi:predicted RNA polymerase sigma factor
MGTRKTKDDALQLALACCEPNLSATFRVSPIS